MATSPNNDPGVRKRDHMDSPPKPFDEAESDRKNLIVAYGTVVVVAAIAIGNIVATNVQNSEEPSDSRKQIPVVRQQFPSQQEVSPGDTITIPPTIPSSP